MCKWVTRVAVVLYTPTEMDWTESRKLGHLSSFLPPFLWSSGILASPTTPPKFLSSPPRYHVYFAIAYSPMHLFKSASAIHTYIHTHTHIGRSVQYVRLQRRGGHTSRRCWCACTLVFATFLSSTFVYFFARFKRDESSCIVVPASLVHSHGFLLVWWFSWRWKVECWHIRCCLHAYFHTCMHVTYILHATVHIACAGTSMHVHTLNIHTHNATTRACRPRHDLSRHDDAHGAKLWGQMDGPLRHARDAAKRNTRQVPKWGGSRILQMVMTGARGVCAPWWRVPGVCAHHDDGCQGCVRTRYATYYSEMHCYWDSNTFLCGQIQRFRAFVFQDTGITMLNWRSGCKILQNQAQNCWMWPQQNLLKSQ